MTANLSASLTLPHSPTRTHVAALRAWLQGMPLQVIAGRWLTTDPDTVPTPQAALQLLHATRDAIHQRALLHGRQDLAAAVSAPGRSGTSMDRAVRAVRELEAIGTPSPKPEHAVALWLARPLAKRLEAAGLSTLADVVALCNARGSSWWRKVPRIGSLAAGRIVRVLGAYETELGPLAPHVRGRTLPAAYVPSQLRPGGGIALPLEAMRVPGSLSGALGANRSPHGHSTLDAQDDYAAIKTWLSLWQEGGPTYRAYRKEAERFLAWIIIERGKAFSDATTEDCVAYRAFLKDPQPVARWCAPRTSRELPTTTPGLRLSNPSWRPFTGPLADRSAKYSETVLASLFSWLVRRHYLHSNPWDGVPAMRVAAVGLQTAKAVPATTWAELLTWLDRQAQVAAQHRTIRAAILLLGETGMRCEEAAGAVGESLERVAATTGGLALDSVWGELRVVGKRSVLRQVPISQRLYAALVDHWADRAIAPGQIPQGALVSPVIAISTPRARLKSEEGREGYSSRGLRTLVAKAYEGFRAYIEAEKPDLVGQLRPFHPHSFRHAFASHAVAAGMGLEVVQGYMGHASLATTTLYTNADRDRRLTEAERFFTRV